MDIGLLARLTISLAVGALVGWMGGLVLGLTASSVVVTVVLRTLLSLGILAILTRVLVRHARASEALSRTVVVAAVLSYAVSPSAWEGRALLGQAFTDPGVVTVVLDLAVWVGIVVLSGRSVEPRPAEDAYRPYETA
jgi:hypothetical protein